MCLRSLCDYFNHSNKLDAFSTLHQVDLSALHICSYEVAGTYKKIYSISLEMCTYKEQFYFWVCLIHTNIHIGIIWIGSWRDVTVFFYKMCEDLEFHNSIAQVFTGEKGGNCVPFRGKYVENI